VAVWWFLRWGATAPPEIAIIDKRDQTKPIAKTPGPAPVAALPAVVAKQTSAPAPVAEAAPGKPAAKMTLADILLPDNRLYDEKSGFRVEYPVGWGVRNVALRWGVNEGENTIFFALPEDYKAASSLYYRKYTDGPAFSMTNPEATLRDMAQQKEVSRISDGRTDYRNDPNSFVFRTIDGNPSLSYFATYTNPNGELHAEYFLRILGPSGYVMFFNYGPVKDVQALIPTVFQMAGTVKPP
jgi:hypothetical protein